MRLPSQQRCRHDDRRPRSLKGKKLVDALAPLYAEDRAAHEASGSSEPFPDYRDWITLERRGTLATLRFVQGGDACEYQR
jgi:hypothetical protein